MIGCSVVPLTIAVSFCALYWIMWTQAQALNDKAPASWKKDELSYYDACGGLSKERPSSSPSGVPIDLSLGSAAPEPFDT